jgi:pimeloyl-ACP methyl ester carboxylesterase
MSHLHPADLQGLSRLAVDGVLGTTSLVEEMHYAIGRVSGPSLPSRDGRTRGITGLVYRSIHGITGLVGQTTDLAFRQIVPRLPQAPSTPQRDRTLAALNGVLGDHLEATGNPLALKMSFRRDGQSLALDRERLEAQLGPASSRIAIFLHGLCMSDHHWTPAADAAERTDLPQALAESAGYLPLHLKYNSGRHISTNGKDFALQLQALFQSWPGPIEELVLIGHSMGGLVARSACHYGQLAGHAWVDKTRRLIRLASPNQGARLERIGNLVDRALALTPFSAPFTRLGRVRSAGITDLRHGNLLEEDWQHRDRFADARGERGSLRLPPHLQIHALAAVLDDEAESWSAHLLGDGLVTVDSALDLPENRLPSLELDRARQELIYGVGHLDLLTHPASAQIVLRWLE